MRYAVTITEAGHQPVTSATEHRVAAMQRFHQAVHNATEMRSECTVEVTCDGTVIATAAFSKARSHGVTGNPPQEES